MVYGIILAGGSGKRVGSDIPKQYIEINGRPLLYYTLKAFEESCADRLVIVADEAHLRYVVSDIVDGFGLKKVVRVCQGGDERFYSVYHGLDDLKDLAQEEDIVLIHDGARPFILPEEIDKMAEAASAYGAAVAAMPVKDTIKITDDSGFVAATTVRKNTWQIQTPQAFRFGLIRNAYERAAGMKWRAPEAEQSEPAAGVEGAGRAEKGPALKTELLDAGKVFTDDSMVIEAVFPQQKIKLVALSYENIKITTPEDLDIAKARLK